MRLALSLLILAACGTTDMTTPDAGGGVTATFTSLYGDYLSNCKQCHAPGAPGRTSDIEQSLDFTTKAMAYTTLKGTATGLMGNFMACNGVPFLAAAAKDSLLLASLDQPTRNAFDYTAVPGCDSSTITDETVKVGSAPSAEFITALKDWVTAGAPND